MGKSCKAVQTARLTALALLALAVAAFSPAPASAARVAVTVEALTVGEGFVVEPTLVDLPSGGATAAEALVGLLRSKNITFRFDGSPTGNDFFLTRINTLETFETYGWMITVRNFFIRQSAGLQKLQDGEVMRWQYTASRGRDLGEDPDALGTNTKADKDALIWKVAEINKAGDKSSYSAYNAALSVLKKLDASQTEADSALAALNGGTPGGGSNNGTDNGSGGGSNNGTDNGGGGSSDTGGGSNNGTDNGSGGGSSGGTDNGSGGGSNNGTDNGGGSSDTGGGSSNGTDNGSNGGSNGGTDNGTSGGTSAKVEAEIRREPAVTPPAGTETGTAPREVSGSEMVYLGFGDIIDTAGGIVTVSENAFTAALAGSGIKVDAGKPVAPLPVFRAGVSPGGTVLVTLRATLDGYAGEALRSVAVFKMTYKGTAARLRRADSPGDLAHGRFIWTDAAGEAMRPDASVTAGTDYYISVAVRDDSELDLDGWTRGSVVDPLALAVEEGAASGSEDTSQGGGGNGWNSSSGGSGGGGGCDVGSAFGIFALAFLGLTAALRRRGG